MGIISKDISKAVALLNAEEVVAIPTETVYGLAGNIFSEKAINSIFGCTFLSENRFFRPFNNEVSARINRAFPGFSGAHMLILL